MGLAAAGSFIAANAATISTVVAVASAAGNYMQQSANAEAQGEYQEKQNQQVKDATIENYKELSKVEQDALYNAGQDSLENQISALQAASSQRATDSALGLGGGSADARMTDIARRKSIGDTDIRMARDQQLQNIDAQAKSLQQGAKANLINSPIQKPSIWGAVAQGASTGASMYNTTRNMGTAMRDSSNVGTGGY